MPNNQILTVVLSLTDCIRSDGLKTRVIPQARGDSGPYDRLEAGKQERGEEGREEEEKGVSEREREWRVGRRKSLTSLCSASAVASAVVGVGGG